MKPGARTRPSASSTRAAVWPFDLPRYRMMPSLPARSPVKLGAPVPSQIRAFLITRSSMPSPLSSRPVVHTLVDSAPLLVPQGSSLRAARSRTGVPPLPQTTLDGSDERDEIGETVL